RLTLINFEGLSMRLLLSRMFFLTFCIYSAAQSNSSISGDWLITMDVFGTPALQVLTLKIEGDKLTGIVHGRGHAGVEGTVSGNVVHFITKQGQDTSGDYEGTLSGDTMSGTAKVFSSKPERRLPGTWSARRLPPLPGGPPERHEFVPTKFQRAFSPFVAPVLHIKSGDSVHTTTVDAGGRDSKSMVRVLGGNPETGPFYVDGAYPGDILKVKLIHLGLNRDWAASDD